MAEYEMRVVHEFKVENFTGEMVVDHPQSDDQHVSYVFRNTCTGEGIFIFEGQLEDFKRIFTDMMNVRSRYDKVEEEK